MSYFVLGKIPNSLSNDDAEEYFSVKGIRKFKFLAIFIKIGIVDKVSKQAILIPFIFFSKEIVLRDKDRETIFNSGQDKSLVPDSTFESFLMIFLFLSFYHDSFIQRLHSFYFFKHFFSSYI